MDKNVHRIFEDKIDKLVHKAYQQQTVPEQGGEWQSLHTRLQNRNKGRKWLIGACLSLALLGIGYTIGVRTNNKAPNVTSQAQATSIDNTTPALADKSSSQIAAAPITNVEQEPQSASNNVANNQVPQGADLPITTLQNKQANKLNSIAKTVAFTSNWKNSSNKKIEPTSQNNKIQIVDDGDENKVGATEQPKSLEERLANKAPSMMIKDEAVTSQTSTQQSTDVTAQSETAAIIDHTKDAIIKDAVTTATPKKARTKREIDVDVITDRTLTLELFTGLTSSKKMANNFTAFLAPSGYVEARLNEEASLSAANIGAYFTIKKNNILFTSGISLLQIGDLTQYKNDTFASINGRAKFNYVEIPLLVGKEFQMNRFSVGIRAGLSAGLLMSSKGKYRAHDNNLYYDLADNKNHFRKVLLSAVIQPQINYYLNEQVNLMIAPVYQRNLQSITNINQDLKQRYNVWGMRIGLQAKLR